MFSFLGEELKVWSTFPGAPLGWSCEVATLCGAVLSPVLATLSWHSRFAARPASFVCHLPGPVGVGGCHLSRGASRTLLVQILGFKSVDLISAHRKLED